MTSVQPTLANLRRLAASIGAAVEVETSRFGWQLYVDLPAGKIIYGAHGNCWSYMPGLPESAEMKKRAIADAIEWLSEPVCNGCETDNQEECDVCSPC